MRSSLSTSPVLASLSAGLSSESLPHSESPARLRPARLRPALATLLLLTPHTGLPLYHDPGPPQTWSRTHDPARPGSTLLRGTHPSHGAPSPATSSRPSHGLSLTLTPRPSSHGQPQRVTPICQGLPAQIPITIVPAGDLRHKAIGRIGLPRPSTTCRGGTQAPRDSLERERDKRQEPGGAPGGKDHGEPLEAPVGGDGSRGNTEQQSLSC